MTSSDQCNPIAPDPTHLRPAGDTGPEPEAAIFRDTFVAQLIDPRENGAACGLAALLAEMISGYEGSAREVGGPGTSARCAPAAPTRGSSRPPSVPSRSSGWATASAPARLPEAGLGPRPEEPLK